MAYQYSLVGRPRKTPAATWDKTIHSPDGVLCDATPAPGRTYTRDTWPPRGRGRGESLYSSRRVVAKMRALEVIRLRASGATWSTIASTLGFKDASGAYRAYRRMMDRAQWDEARRAELAQ